MGIVSVLQDDDVVDWDWRIESKWWFMQLLMETARGTVVLVGKHFFISDGCGLIICAHSE
jgi:hypothetical protein